MGDKSDNITSCFKKCGKKTALKCIQDKNFYQKIVNKHNNFNEKYKLNKTLIDFNEIPMNLQNKFNDYLDGVIKNSF